MPDCDNCGGFVTERYVRVFAPTGRTSVRACPQCEDAVRSGGTVRRTRAHGGDG
ncbi:DUF7563 family protein [Candidatus Halobonum tyrrellensis]